MANQPVQQLPSISNTFEKGMVKDIIDAQIPQGFYTNAVNASISLPDGSIGALNTECANRLGLQKVPLILIGTIYLHENLWTLYWTDNNVSEVGTYNELTDEYIILINDAATIAAGLPGLGFKTTNLITGVARRGYDCGFNVYWSDGRLNPDRVLDTAFLQPNPFIQNVTTVGGCITYTNTNRINVNQLRLAPLYSVPCLKLGKSNQSGILQNGSYQVAIRYSINGTRATDYVAVSNIQSIWSHTGEAGAIVLNCSNLETTTFIEMEVVVISFVNLQIQAKRVGLYSTTQSTIYIDRINNEWINVPLENIPISTPAIEKSDAIFSNGDYLLRAGTTQRPDINYQPLANQITAHWTCIEYPEDYYHKGGNGNPMNVGYMRGETYPYYIRGVYTTGDKTASYPIPCTSIGATFNLGGPSTGDGGITIASGTFDPYISTEVYPSNQPLSYNSNVPGHPEFNLCGQPIRHHKFPDQASTFGTGGVPGAPGQPTLSHYYNYGSVDNPITTIRIMAVYFDNIQPFLDLNGNVVTDIQGYEILRGTRDGNASVIACGQVNHMRGYQNADGTVGLYQNYPYDDLHADRFLTTSQIIGTVGGTVDGWGGNELSIVSPNVVSFHSPETVFNNPYLGSGTLELTMATAGEAVGSFDIPYKHPMFRLLTNQSSKLSALITGVEVLSDVLNLFTGTNLALSATDDLPMASPLSFADIPDGSFGTISDVAYIAATIAQGVMAALLIPIKAKVFGQQILNIINGLVPASQYARQYNSHGFYSIPVATGEQILGINDYQYIKGQIQYFGGQVVNNLYRNNYVAVQCSTGLPLYPAPYNSDPVIPGIAHAYTNAIVFGGYGSISSSVDCSRFTFGQGPPLPLDASPSGNILSPIISWYGRYRVPMNAQYGQIDSPKQVPIGCMQTITPVSGTRYTSSVLFGGDVYINRYTEQNPFMYFNDWLFDVSQDYQYDYTQYENVPYPRYWINNSKVYHEFWSMAAENYHLEELPSPGIFDFWVKSGHFYLFNNGVRDFYVESTVNVGYRDYGDSIEQQFYNPYGYTNIAEMFRSDIIKKPVFYKYDYSLSANRFWNQWFTWGQCLKRDYNPTLAYICFSYYPRRLNYSLPQGEENIQDNWKIFLPNNYKDLPAQVQAVKSFNKTGMLVLLDDCAPVQINGQESIPSKSGTEYSTGTGQLFSQAFQTTLNVDDGLQYGSCQGKFCSVSTPHGTFWISQKSGKVFYFDSSIPKPVEIAGELMKYWLAKYLPSQLLAQFPQYPLIDNPVAGVGVQLVYDNTTDVLYICKKDKIVLPQYVDSVFYNSTTGELYTTSFLAAPSTSIVFRSLPVPDSWFEDASWTLSYSCKERKWISFHSWEPTLVLQGMRNIITCDPGGTSLWHHNDNSGLFCNYYGTDYPFILELPLNTSVVNTIENIEYWMDAYLYTVDFATDKYNQFYNGFDYSLIYNNEQSTLPLLLTQRPNNDPYGALHYPFITASGNNTLYNKVEQKYRFSTIRDYTSERGQNNLTTIQLKQTRANGYLWDINPNYLNFSKNQFQLKKIRHFNSKLLLKKNIVGNRSMSLRYVKTNTVNSFR